MNNSRTTFTSTSPPPRQPLPSFDSSSNVTELKTKEDESDSDYESMFGGQDDQDDHESMFGDENDQDDESDDHDDMFGNQSNDDDDDDDNDDSKRNDASPSKVIIQVDQAETRDIKSNSSTSIDESLFFADSSSDEEKDEEEENLQQKQQQQQQTNNISTEDASIVLKKSTSTTSHTLSPSTATKKSSTSAITQQRNVKIPRKKNRNHDLLNSSSSSTIPRKKRKLSPSSSLSSSQYYKDDNTLVSSNDPQTTMNASTYGSYDGSSSGMSSSSSTIAAAATAAATTTATVKLLKPDEYPHVTMDEFWRIFRSWDFIHDLNQLNIKTNNNNQEDPNDTSSTTTIVSSPALPDTFHCHEQYKALWSPLLFKEIKAQLISDVTSICNPSTPISTYVQSVKVTSKKIDKNNGNDHYSQVVTLNIQSNSGDTANPRRYYHSGKSNRNTNNNINPKNGSGNSNGNGNGAVRNVKATQLMLSKNEFVQNELILLIAEPSFLDQAYKGVLKLDDFKKGTSGGAGGGVGNGKKSTYSMASLISNASPFSNGRLAIVGIVMHRSRNLDSGIVVQVSKRLWKSVSNGSLSLSLLRLGLSVTAIREFKALCNTDEMPLLKYLLPLKLLNKKLPIVTKSQSDDTTSSSVDNPLSEFGGRNALGIGFRIWVKSKFNHSQQAAINAAAREYGDGGFTLVKGPPGTGKTTTLAAIVNALHLRQYQRYYSEIQKITLSVKSSNHVETLTAISAAANVKPRILICAPSNAAIDNIIMKIMEDKFIDGNGGKYKPSIVRVGAAFSAAVAKVTLNQKVEQIIAEGTKTKDLRENIKECKKDLRRLEIEIGNLQRRVRLIANAAMYRLSRDWEIRIDEENFTTKERVLFVNHKLKKVELKCPPKPDEGESLYPVEEMPHYRQCMNSLVKYIERHNDLHSKLMQLTLVQNAASSLDKKNYIQNAVELNQQLEQHVLDSTHIVMTTLGSAGSKTMDSMSKFSVIVVDEAAQCSEPSILSALQLGSSHCVLVGDPQQLPPTIYSVSGRNTKYDRSLFQRLEEGGHQVHMLNTQYRMHPKISSFPREIFYDGSLLDGPNVKSQNYGGDLSQLIKSKFCYFQPLTILDLDSSEEREGTNLSNADEARLALHLFSSLDTETNGLSKKSRIAILTPYMQQVVVIRRMFEEKFGLGASKMVDFSTIDAFQGKEASIVILSCVRGASRGVGIGFLSDVRRMNVALTRAKHYLFVIARCRTIVINPYWRDLVAHARKQRAILKVVPTRDSKSIGDKRKGGKIGWAFSGFPNLQLIKPIHHDVTVDIKTSNNYLRDSQKYHQESDGNISA